MSSLSRRAVIAMSGKALFALAASGPLTRAVFAKEPDYVSWERFLELSHALSKAQFAENWDQNAYTRDLERLICRLQLSDQKIIHFVERYRNLNLDFPEIRSMHHESQFMVAMLDFEPGEEIPLHDHPDMTGVAFCTTGRVAISHYDKLEETAENGNPLLQFERHIDMSPGDTAALTANRGNIHTLRASRFTRMIDVFTPPYDRDRVERARYYTIDSSPYLGRAGIFAAEASISPPSVG